MCYLNDAGPYLFLNYAFVYLLEILGCDSRLRNPEPTARFAGSFSGIVTEEHCEKNTGASLFIIKFPSTQNLPSYFWLSYLQVIAKARVPIIKFVEKRSGVAFDIRFAKQSSATI